MIGEKVSKYIIEAEIGAGGMGVVYRARDLTNERPVAIKVLLPQFSTNPEIVQRFFNEAMAATSIQHPGIIEILDVGVLPMGSAFLVMELLTGEPLTDWLTKPRSIETSVGVAREIASALAAAHDKAIVHRDLKPDNVFVLPDPTVAGGHRIKLLDFGVAKLSPELSGQQPLRTRVGTVMGTPAYMSPEQCRGAMVDHRADIYSLGCVMYELIAGRPPFLGTNLGEILGSQLYKTAPALDTLVPGVPRALSALVAKLLAKEAADRPQSVHNVIDAIDAQIEEGAYKHAPAARPSGEHAQRAADAATIAPSGDQLEQLMQAKRPALATEAGPPVQNNSRMALVAVLIVLVIAVVVGVFFALKK